MNKNISLPPISDIFQSGVPDPFGPRPSLYPYASPYYGYEHTQAHIMAPRGAMYAWKHEAPPVPGNTLLHPNHSASPSPHFYNGGAIAGVSPRNSVSSNESSSFSSEHSTPRNISPNMGTQHLASATRSKTRNNLPKETTYILLKWLNEHLSHPYPNSFEKTQLMVSTGLNQQQLSNWFINARRRKIKYMRHNQENKS